MGSLTNRRESVHRAVGGSDAPGCILNQHSEDFIKTIAYPDDWPI